MNRPIARFGAAVLFAALALPALAHEASAASSTPTPQDGYFQTITPVAEGVWLIAQPQPFHIQPIGNVVVIEQSDGLVLIDAGGSPGAGRRIVELVRSVSAKPVKAVAITHWHGDHVLGATSIVQAWPTAEIIATDVTDAHLRGRSMKAYAKGSPDAALQAQFDKRLDGAETFLRDTLAKPDLSTRERDGFEASQRLLAQYRRDTRDLVLVLPTRTFVDSLKLDDARRPVELRHPGRGNTDGDLIAWLPRQRVMATGDLVVAPIPFGFNAYPADWERTLRAMQAQHPAVWIPGHGAAMRDDAYVGRVVDLIGRTRDAIAPLAAQGVTIDEAKKRVNLSGDRAHFVGDDAWLTRWFDRYWTQPFIDAAWREAKGEPIEQGEG
ncbi:MBL fold metallo-hydrolase [Lysobacter auxotrophicus]|uniref:MBL fold metallo-hydrolase n=1 Tax=Lysobacter auxotrophicus TaxID=2992573 RepID=A0ABN6UHD4_9GAMM|nr:MBL fold metallo-hydrolase [Lysobacter auxotrophicus]BDU14998.1 MBL fold metallo-hydrolase [Lysobacter auxotrophicus]